jgi:hypothetical protein
VRRVVFAALLLVVAGAARAEAHGMRTALVEVLEISPGQATVHLRQTAPDPSLTVIAGPGCVLEPAGDGGSIYEHAWRLDCAGAGAAEPAIEVAGLGPIVSEAVVWIVLADGTTRSELVHGAPRDATRVALRRAPATASTLEVARQFVNLGLVHIATGYDHLLFLLLLVLLLRDVRSVLLAETAFTISHSLSFSATALGWLHVSATAAEACIALSLVMLARDVRPGSAAAERWRGAGMALAFGFVHGLGFAAGLREIGLPEHAIGAALVGFGAGIELGQVAFLAVVLTILHLVRDMRARPAIERVAIYAIGALSSWWLIVRVLAISASSS